MPGWRVYYVLITIAATAVSAQTLSSSDLIERSRLIYEAGQLGSGEPLVGHREGGVVSTGVASACVTQQAGAGL
jgi:hypothetical protein